MARQPRPIRLQPLWARVDENRLRLGIFVVLYVLGSAVLLTTAFVAVPGFLIGALLIENPAQGYWSGALLAWAIAFGVALAAGAFFSAVQLANAEHWVRGRLLARDLKRGEDDDLISAVQDMSVAAGLTEPPRIVVTAGDIDDVNAFALGTTRSEPVIGVTPGFLAALTQDEQRAVVAVLVARIIAGDIMFGTALAALMGPLKAIRESPRLAGKGCAGGAGGGAGEGSGTPAAGAGKKKSGSDWADGCGSGCGDGCGDLDLGDRAGYFILVVIVIVVLTYVAVLSSAWIVTLWGRLLQRTAQEKADAEGMLLLKDPGPMLSAFRKTAQSSNQVANCDPSYDGIFYTATSGSPRIERVEERRYLRLREVLGVEGLAAEDLSEGDLSTGDSGQGQSAGGGEATAPREYSGLAYPDDVRPFEEPLEPLQKPLAEPLWPEKRATTPPPPEGWEPFDEADADEPGGSGGA